MARGGFPKGMGGMGGGNMNNMLRQAKKMQEEMEKAQQDLEQKELEASVGGGAVSVKVNGKKEVLSITLSPDAVDPDDVDMLQDLIVTAVNEALRKADEAAASSLGSITGGMSIPGLF